MERTILNKDSPQDSIVSSINSKLNEAKSRFEGFDLIIKHLPNLSNDIFLQYAHLWISKLIQELENRNNSINNLNNICKTMGILILTAKEIPEINKIISMQYVKQMLNILTNFDSDKQFGGKFYLMSVIIYCFPEVSEKMQASILNMILSVVDSDDEVLVKGAAKNYALLSKCIERSFKSPPSKPYHNGYMYNEYLVCNTLHLIIDELFPHFKNSDVEDDVVKLDIPKIIEDDIILYFELLERRINNLCVYLCVLLSTHRNKMSVSTSDILHLLCKYYEVILQNKSSDSIREQYIEPMLLRLYVSLSSVLNSLIIGFGPDLLPNAIPILQLIHQSFSWTEKVESHPSFSDSHNQHKDLVLNIRIAAYQSLSTWLKCCGSASVIEWIADKFLPFFLKDIIPETSTVLLCAQNTQHMSRKALKKFRALQSQNPSKPTENKKQHIDMNTKSELCTKALSALQKTIIKGNYLLKSIFYEEVEINIIPCLYYLYAGIRQTNCYTWNSNCRLELLRTLKTLLVVPHPDKPLPLANSIEILKLALHDHISEIAEEAELILNIIEKICHPSAPSFILPLQSTETNLKKRFLDEGNDENEDIEETDVPPSKQMYISDNS